MKQSKVQSPKLPKGVSQEFVDGIQSMSTEQLKAQIVIVSVQSQENDAFKETDEYLASEDAFADAKAMHDLVAGPVKEVAIGLKNKVKVLVERLKEKGGA